VIDSAHERSPVTAHEERDPGSPAIAVLIGGPLDGTELPVREGALVEPDDEVIGINGTGVEPDFYLRLTNRGGRARYVYRTGVAGFRDQLHPDAAVWLSTTKGQR
jgi:hypothetical protein